MIRSLKLFGLALVAIAALVSLGASAAQATPTFQANTANEWHVTGTAFEGHRFTLPVAQVICEKPHFDPAATYKTPSTTTVTITPTYDECYALIGMTKFEVTIFHEECTYKFHAKEKLAADTYKGTFAIECPAGQAIVVKVYKGMSHKDAERRCEYKVEPQEVSNVLTHNDTVNHDLVVTTGTAYAGSKTEVVTKRTFGSPFECGGAEVKGDYESKTTFAMTAVGEETVEGSIEGE